MIQIITNNFVTLFELIGLLVILGISVHITPRQRRYTVTVVVLLMLLILCRETEFYSQSFEKVSPLRYMMTAGVYSLYPLIMACLTGLITEGMFKGKKILFLLIPEFLTAPLYFTSQWTKLVFYFSEDNHYQGGPLSSLPYAVFGLYYALFVAFTAYSLRRADGPVKPVMRYIVYGAGVGGAIQLIFVKDSGNGDFSLLFTAAVVLYYLFIYINQSRMDPLTGLLNRQSYYLDMKSDKIAAVVSVDMNDLKYYNDYHGHEAGDAALRAVSEVMKKYSGPAATVYRVGGDEFVILYRNADRNRVEASVVAMEENMKKTPYVCAFGIAMSFEGGSVEEMLTIADGRMYEHKATLKKRTRLNEQQ